MNFIPVVVFKLAVGSVFILFVSLYSLFGIETNRSLLCKYIVILSFCKIFCAFFMIRAFFAESASRGFWLLMFDDSSAAAAVADFCILGHVGNLAGEMACLSRFFARCGLLGRAIIYYYIIWQVFSGILGKKVWIIEKMVIFAMQAGLNNLFLGGGGIHKMLPEAILSIVLL